MIQGNKNSDRTNGEGYADPTAYEAIRLADDTEDLKIKAKKFLYGYRDATKAVTTLDLEIEQMEDEIDAISVKLDGMPRGTDISDRTGNYAAKLADLKLKAVGMRQRQWEKRMEIVEMVNTLKADYHTIIYEHFINGKVFELIAFEMDYSFRQIMRKYERALIMIGRKMS